MSVNIVSDWIFEDSGATFMARIRGNNGVAIVQADISSISWEVYDPYDDTTTASGSLTVSAVVYNSLQQSDSRWTRDGDGFNFLHAAPASAFTTGDRQYTVEYKFTPASGEVFRAQFKPRTQPVII